MNVTEQLRWLADRIEADGLKAVSDATGNIPSWTSQDYVDAIEVDEIIAFFDALWTKWREARDAAGGQGKNAATVQAMQEMEVLDWIDAQFEDYEASVSGTPISGTPISGTPSSGTPSSDERRKEGDE